MSLTGGTRRLSVLFAIALSLLTACAGGARSENAAQTKAGAATPQPKSSPSQESTSAAGGQKLFRGFVGDEYAPATMRLARAAGGELSGSYSYEGRGGELTLKGSVDDKGNFTLEEFDGANKTGTFEGLWREKEYEPAATLSGDWTKPGGDTEESFYFTEQPRDAGGPAVRAKQIREGDKRHGYTVNVSYPQLEGAGGEKFNRLAESLAKKHVADFKSEVGGEEGAKDAETGEAVSSVNVNYNLRLATAELVSAELAEDYYERGMAHPSHSFDVINYDLKAGRALQLADLFQPGSDYLQRISHVAVEQVRKWNKDSAQEPGGGGEPYLSDPGFEEGAAPKAENYRNWTLTPKGLAVTFDYYQLGPYAAGAQTVLVPYAELKDVIKSDGPLAPLLK